MPTVHVESEEELLQLAADMFHIMVNMRLAQNYWQEHYGAENRKRKREWEEKADALLAKHGITEHSNRHSIRVFVNDEK